MSAQPLEIRMAHLEGAYEQISHRLNGIDSRLGAIEQRFVQIDQRFAQIDQRFIQIDRRFAQIDQRFAQIDQRFAQIDEHFRQVELNIVRLDQKIDAKFELLSEKIDQRSLWLMGLVVISIILPVAMKLSGH